MRFTISSAITLAAVASVSADLIIYQDTAINTAFQDWSWGSTILYNATDIKEGLTSISVNSTAYSALSLVDGSGTFQGYAGIQFDVAGPAPAPDVSVSLSSTTDNNASASWALSSFGAAINPNSFTTLTLNFNNLPPGNGAILYHIDNIIVLSTITIAPQILSAEPIGTNVIAITTTGTPDLSTVKVTLNNNAIAVTGSSVSVPVDTPSKSITYLTLASPLAPGNLAITTSLGSFSYVLPASLSGTVNQATSYPISKYIYGVNFPTSASYIAHLGITLSRWGGNAVTAYNPFGGFTNAGNDWYFENRNSDSADTWLGWVNGASSGSLLTIPALDWVAKDNTSYSFSKMIYPNQQAFDTFLPDAGDGLLPNGSWVSPPPNPTNAYTPWNTSLAKQWLTGLQNKPMIVTIDNEIEIASSTHQDMHPNPIGYDEELARVLNTSMAAKAVLPNVLVAAPSTCAWYFYWRSSIGTSDTTAHNNTDFIPWFLQQMQAHQTATGQRLLDYLDLHYYFQASITTATDPTTEALRLRLSRSLWDPTYVDESWVATSTTSNQPNSTIIQLIPRIHSLIQQYYPGTKFSLSEWSSTSDNDLTGGLLTVDMLGIFGRYQLDAATYWSDPDELGPVGLAYWLYRGYGTYFGSSSAQVTIPGFNPNTLGVYAGTEAGKNLTLVVVNKDPSNPVALNLSGVPAGTYFLRHYGGKAGIAKFQTTITISSSSYIVVPAYTAVFLQQRSASVTTTTTTTTTTPTTTTPHSSTPTTTPTTTTKPTTTPTTTTKPTTTTTSTKSTTTTTKSTTTTTTTKSTTTTTKSTTTSSTTSSAPTACATHYGQCGGIGWTGPTCCQAGSTCTGQASNPYYSQCL